jgi:hypothetical protein
MTILNHAALHLKTLISKHPYDSLSINRGTGHLTVMIIFLVTKALST